MATLAIHARPYNGNRAVPFQTPAPVASEHLHTDGNFSEVDDATVMLELRAGNMAAFDFLLQKYRKPIVHFMFRMVRNQAVAEELAQEVFLRVYRSRETYRAEARFSTWLYRIATNLGVNHARDTKQERSASTIYLDETDTDTGTTPDLADSTPGVESAMLRRERMNAIREVVHPFLTGSAWQFSCTSTRRWTTGRSATSSSCPSPPPNRSSFAHTRLFAKS